MFRKINKMAKHLTPTQTNAIPQIYADYIVDGISEPEAVKKIANGLGKTTMRIRQILKSAPIFENENDILELEPLPKAEVAEKAEIDYCKVDDLVSEDFEIPLLEKPNLPKKKRIKLTGSKVELFATDIHFPFEFKPAWQIFLDVAKEMQPDIIWCNEMARIEYLPSGIFHVQPSLFIKDEEKAICRVDGQWFEKEIQI